MGRWFSIDPGDDLDRSLRGAIDECSVVALLASKEALSSPWVSREIEHARARGISPRFISVLLDGTLPADLPGDLSSMVCLPWDLGLAAIARRIIHAETQSENAVADAIPVWIRLADDQIVQPVGSLTPFPTITAVHVLNAEWQNVLHEILRSSRPDLAWLGNTESSQRWREWVYNMPARAELAVDSLCSVLNDSLRHIDNGLPNESEFAIGFCDGWMQVVVRRLQEALKLLRHFGDPHGGHAPQEELASWQPYPDGIWVDLAWTSPSAGRGKSRTPMMVEAIDLPFGMHNASAVVFPRQLGLMTGSATAAEAWVKWGDPVAASRTPQLKIPDFETLLIGPA